MDIAVFSTKSYDIEFFEAANRSFGHRLDFLQPRLGPRTAALATGKPAICVFVNDDVSRGVIEALSPAGLQVVALRCAGFNNVDLRAAEQSGVAVVRVPAYSPHAVAEHTVALLLALNRKLHRAYLRVREGNFSLTGLIGFELHQHTVGIVGTGKIGEVVARILGGFGCRLLGYDIATNPECQAAGVEYVELDDLLQRSDIITLHCPLTPRTHHLIDRHALAKMRKGAILINTSRGAIIDTRAVIDALKSGQIAGLAMDVYEEEGDLFFEDLSDQVIRDDVFTRLLTFPNVLITGHQAFFTTQAMTQIATTTLQNISCIEKNQTCEHQIGPDLRQAPPSEG